MTVAETALFSPFAQKGLTLKNRVVMSPMCQYSVTAEDGVLNDWHRVHYVSRAVGGVGLVLVEMTNVLPDGRITVRDSGIWNDAQRDALARIADEVHGYGAAFGVQIAHAGRKAESPSLTPFAPSAIPFSDHYRTPEALSGDAVDDVVLAFQRAAERVVAAGADVVELHGAHGYLLHQFMSPASNQRTDRYGEPTAFPAAVIRAVHAALPPAVPLWMRVSATEWSPAGYDFSALTAMARVFRAAGVDLFDVSSGGNLPVRLPGSDYPGYQAGFAAQLKAALNVPVMAVGRLDDPPLANWLVATGQADLAAVGRGLLADPYWANTASLALGGPAWLPRQYDRAMPADRLPAGPRG